MGEGEGTGEGMTLHYWEIEAFPGGEYACVTTPQGELEEIQCILCGADLMWYGLDDETRPHTDRFLLRCRCTVWVVTADKRLEPFLRRMK